MRTPGTIEVSEADYRRLVDERRMLLEALKLARDWMAPVRSLRDEHKSEFRSDAAKIDAAIKLAEGD